jgi:hypothetical protein
VAAALDAEPEESDDEADADSGDGDGEGDADGDDKPRRRRGRRGGRGRKSGGGRGGARKALEGTFDHGDEGYGLWLDPAVQDDPVYAEHWAGQRPVTVTVEQDQIVIRRAGEDAASSDDGDSSEDEPAPESALDPDEFDA